MGAAAAALLLGGAGVLMGAGTARAAEVSYATECLPPPISGLPPVEGTTTVDVQAPATAKVGDEVEVVWKTVQAASKNPPILDIEENTVLPTGTITVGGAQTGELAMEGPRENPAIPKDSPMKLSDMKGKLKLTQAGEVTLTPGAYNINVSKPLSTDTKCSAKETVKAAATIKVTGSGSTTTGGTTTGGNTTGGTTTGGNTTGGNTTGGTTTGTTTGGTTTGGNTTGGNTTGGGGGGDSYTGKEVPVAYACKTPIGDKNATSSVRIDAVKNGGSFDLTVKFGKSVMDSPVDIPADSVKPSMKVKVGGADKGTVAVTGPTNKGPIKSGDPIEIPDLTGTYKPGASGKSTLTPGVLTVNALGTTTTCTPANDTQASLELDTTAQSNGTSGGNGSGGNGSSGSGSSGGGTTSSGASTSGGLAETGASDHGGLKALGLVAGTVTLLGAAVFTLTPWRKLRGTR
ncbi:hypothetical protein SBI_04524 [Streptomyces bingchenggensis BCW-1]|uniref:LPXTG-motif cell wall anchor domain protein n=1 Tax=Streptomyces bingchenggensis (strain BCW-1) TaxID=749414 RepID=D7BX71_STRBB|nr:hypothetical protein SBI_04524 [Streptomyces bingchenggensis BCW-1]